MLTAEEARKITEEAKENLWEEERAHADVLLDGIDKAIREACNKGMSAKEIKWTTRIWHSIKAQDYARDTLTTAGYLLSETPAMGTMCISW